MKRNQKYSCSAFCSCAWQSNQQLFLSLAVSIFKKVASPMSVKAVKWMECMFAKVTVIMNLCSLEKKIHLNRLIQKSVKNRPKQS